MSGAPTVSIITAVYNGAALIGDTIASVLAQSFADFEMIVVDDGSQDDTLAVVRCFDDPRIKVIEGGTNEGPVRARNRAFALARGRYVAGLDHDDICRPDRLARQVAYLHAHPGTVLVGTAAERLEAGRLRPPPPPHRTSPALIRFLLDLANPLVWSSVMIRGDVARRLDPFTRPEIVYAEDFDLYHRLAPHGAIARLDQPLMVYRRHAGGVSRVNAERMLARAIDVLAAAHRPVFGAAAEASAALVARHVGGKQPIPDVVTLARVAVVLDRLLDHCRRTQPLDGASSTLIATEASHLWWRLVRTSVHAGALTRREALSVRPASSLVGRTPPRSQLLVAELVGRARALRQPRGRAAVA